MSPVHQKYCLLFDEDLRNKLTSVNFIAILIDGTDAVKEQVLHVMFVDPDTNRPSLAYFECLKLDDHDQTAGGMLESIRRSFEVNSLADLWNKIIYLSADGASVKSGKDSGLDCKTSRRKRMDYFCLVLQPSLTIGFEGRFS